MEMNSQILSITLRRLELLEQLKKVQEQNLRYFENKVVETMELLEETNAKIEEIKARLEAYEIVNS